MSFTPKQLKCIELLASAELDVTDIASELKVARSTIYKWKKLPGFMEAVVSRARDLLKESLPKVYSKLASNAGKGDIQHIRTLLEHLEKLEETRANQAQITFTWKGSNDPTGA